MSARTLPWVQTIYCERCGSPEPTVEITRLGEREPRYMSARPCPCPGPRCPCCRERLVDGRCNTTGCAIDGHLVPDPVIA